MTIEQIKTFTVSTSYWHHLDDGRVQCDVCPRYCKMREGQRGLCYVRGCENGQVKLFSYGRSSGFCIDPIEKKPLNHFYPGSSVLSFGTAGCNLACKFCQNWDISKSRGVDKLCAKASPIDLANAAKEHGCKSMAYTYNDPIVFLEYAIDTAKACREIGIKNVAVTSGYICTEPRNEFFKYMDAVNIDLKSFNDEFYYKLCGGRLDNVLETIKYIHHHTDCWLELTTLLIPGENDSVNEITALSDWVLNNLGTDVPLHFTAFHPDWKMKDTPPTRPHTLTMARNIANKAGLNYVYTGNVHDTEGSSTYCPSCQKRLIERDRYVLGEWNLRGGSCKFCGHKIAGKFETKPSNFGAKRIPVSI